MYNNNVICNRVLLTSVSVSVSISRVAHCSRPSKSTVLKDVKDSLLLGSLKVRVVLGSWLVGASVVYWGYSGNLTSLLAVRHIPQPIQTLRDLIDDPSVTIIMKPNTIVTDTISVMSHGSTLV